MSQLNLYKVFYFHHLKLQLYIFRILKDILYFLQRLRDEAHRFAIGFHRQKRANELTKSALDDIAGVGRVRKQALLRRFGSVREITRAGIEDLQTVEGINASLAQRIYNYFHC